MTPCQKNPAGPTCAPPGPAARSRRAPTDAVRDHAARMSVDDHSPSEGHLPTTGARLYYRTIGEGRPIIVLHGGPDFDHNYLVPELDRLAESFRLVYYDQRGRGRSAGAVRAEDVGIASEIEDVESVRRHFGFDQVTVLGHSWGGVLAMEYATRHAEHVSHLILLGTAPASRDDWLAFREHLPKTRAPGDVERLRALASSAGYEAGDLEVEKEYCRIHFSPTIRDREALESVVGRLYTHFTEETVLTARAIVQRLYEDTWMADGYDLIPKLRALRIPTLVLHGEHDFIPVAFADRVAQAMPCARLVVLEGCGHFAYVESPDAVHEHVLALFATS